MEHCDKGPLIAQLREDSQETHRKLDKVIDVLTAVAVQKERVDALGKKAEDMEKRMRRIEDQPRRFLLALGSAGLSLVVGAAIYLLGWKG